MQVLKAQKVSASLFLSRASVWTRGRPWAATFDCGIGIFLLLGEVVQGKLGLLSNQTKPLGVKTGQY
jgi:hypothetical protein